MKGRLMLTVMLAVSFSIIAEENSLHWSYEGLQSPAHWGKLSPDFALCESGKNQSPVNIQGALKTHHSKLDLAFRLGKQQIINNGHTIQINVSEGNTLRLDKDTFTLQQFHFHTPSENKVDGKQFPLEGHFVYKGRDESLAVLALMFKEGKANPQLAKVWQHIPASIDQTVSLSQLVDIKTLLPGKFKFYRFSGSLTTPPCSEGVIWIVLEQPVSASAEQIRQFRSLFHHTNNRPVQPLNGRVIIH